MPKYCLAETIVNGEVIIQGSSVTYSATASALASGSSFESAANVATIDSNTAAVIAARKTVNNILIEYSYVLSDTDITSMINNSLNTTVHPIIPIALKSIATTIDGKNYVLNKDTIIAKYEYLLIPKGKRLTVTGKFKFINYGIISVGEATSPTKTTGCVGCSSVNKATSTTCPTGSANPCCINGVCSSGLTIDSTAVSSTPTNYGTFSISAGSCLEIDAGVTYFNYSTFTNEGCIALMGGKFTNATSTDPVGTGQLNNTGTFYSAPSSS